VARIQYLVGIGFQMLADDRLSTEEWRKIRDFSKDSVDVITNRAWQIFDPERRMTARRRAPAVEDKTN